MDADGGGHAGTGGCRRRPAERNANRNGSSGIIETVSVQWRRNGDFEDRDAVVLGASTDTHFVHLAWRRSHDDLRTLPFPMLADTKRELATALGILHRQDGVALRATFIVDPEGIIRHVSVNDLSVGRNRLYGSRLDRRQDAARGRATPLLPGDGGGV